MPKQLFQYKNSLVPMDPQDVSKALTEAINSTATGEFNIIPNGISEKLKLAIKESWPEALRNRAREKALELAGGAKPGPADVHKALESVLQDEARKRAKERGGNFSRSLRQEMRYFAVDFALSLLFQVPPNPSPNSLMRDFGGLTVSCKTSNRIGRLVVPCSDADKANAYVFGLFSEQHYKIYLLGWAGRKDIKKGPSGSRFSESEEVRANCPWKRESHYIEYRDLRPLGALLKAQGMKDIPEGVLTERVPDEQLVPSNARLPIVDPEAPDPGDDFDRVIFGEDPAKASGQPDNVGF